jgi:hypothetical protein
MRRCQSKSASLKATKTFVHPTASRDYVTLDDAGFTALVLVAARQQLPLNLQWQPPLDAGTWRQTAVSEAWSFDGRRCQPLARPRVGQVEHGPKPFADLCDTLQARPDVAAVRALAFSVKPKPRQPGGAP